MAVDSTDSRSSSYLLVSHNGRTFDFVVLTHALLAVGKHDRFCQAVTAFADSLKLLRHAIPERSSYKQEDLVHNVLHEEYGAPAMYL